jgi:lysophospholipase L1-like esterase
MLIIEEEQPGFCSVDGIVETTNAGFSGTGYLNANNTMTAGIDWSIAIGQAGTVSLSIVYANGGADRPAEVLVDDVAQSTNVSFPTTTDWTTWGAVSVDLTLEAGTHSLALEPLSADGLANIDRIELVGIQIAAAECPVVEEPDGTTPVTIWLAGDSTVANGSTPCPSGWGKFFANEFNESVTVNNWAVGGRSVRTWLYDVTDVVGGDTECVINTDGQGRIVQSRWTDMLAQMKQGDYLFIQFGINDGDTSCPRHVGGAAFKEEYAMMAQAAFALGVQPIFLTPVSMIRCSGSTPTGSRGFLTETFDVGAAEGVPVIDLHQLSVDLYTSLNFCPIPGGDVSASTTGPVGDFFCDDHTHFSDIGGAQIAGVVADAVATSGLGLATYLK